jgi:hydroxymethylpyrimidine pyrophosphatase-like HAD family hydrolase
MTIYLFCNVLGSFLFDSNGKIIKKSTLSPDKVKVLAEGAWLNEEKNLIKGNEDVVCLNLKEKYDEVTKADFTDEKVQAVYEKNHAIIQEERKLQSLIFTCF